MFHVRIHDLAEAKASKSSSSAADDSTHIKQEKSNPKDKQRRDRKRKAEGGDDLDEEVDGMNENFGSFEDCLGSIDPKKHKKKRKLNGNKLSAAASPKMTVSKHFQ